MPTGNHHEQCDDQLYDRSAGCGDEYIGGASDDWDSRKAFLSRVPAAFDADIVKRIIEKKFGEGCVEDVSIVYNREDDEGDDGQEGADDKGGGIDPRSTGGVFDRSATNTNKNKSNTAEGKQKRAEHRGFGFVTFVSNALRDEAIAAGTARGGAKDTSKRKHTIYIRPLDRSTTISGVGGGDELDNAVDGKFGKDGGQQLNSKNACHLWSLHRCPYGDECKYEHVGEGGCILINKEPLSKAERDKKKKCFQFKKKGKCKLGEDCPFSHDISSSEHADYRGDKDDAADGKKKGDGKSDKSEKDCINWKTKGKCRKLKSRGGCPYRHEEAVREALLAKKEDKKRKRDKSKKEDKIKQPLWVRVFGMNYDTKEEDVREFFKDCGPIMEIAFPKYEDSGRSKGYCGVLFQSPKAVEKAVMLNESQLHGRWLSVQAGKMYLKQWEERERKSRGGGNQDGYDYGAYKHEASTRKSNIRPGAPPEIGEFGQKVKRRKRHGYEE